MTAAAGSSGEAAMPERETYDTEWYGEPVVCCARCHFVQFEGEPPNHAVWCVAAPAPVAAVAGGGGS